MSTLSGVKSIVYDNTSKYKTIAGKLSEIPINAGLTNPGTYTKVLRFIVPAEDVVSRTKIEYMINSRHNTDSQSGTVTVTCTRASGNTAPTMKIVSDAFSRFQFGSKDEEITHFFAFTPHITPSANKYEVFLTIAINSTVLTVGGTDNSFYIRLKVEHLANVSNNQYVNTSIPNLVSTNISAPLIDLISSIPADNDTSVPITTNITLTFNTDIFVGPVGKFIRLLLANGTEVETFDVQLSGQITYVGTNQVVVQPTANLVEAAEYYIVIDQGAFENSDRTPFAGFDGSIDLNFFTPYPTPALSATTPADNELFADPQASISLDFNTAIVAGTGNITVYDESGVFADIDITSNLANISGNTITLTTPDLAPKASYYIQADAGVIKNPENVIWTGINNNTDFNFSTDFFFVGGASAGIAGGTTLSGPGTVGSDYVVVGSFNSDGYVITQDIYMSTRTAYFLQSTDGALSFHDVAKYSTDKDIVILMDIDGDTSVARIASDFSSVEYSQEWFIGSASARALDGTTGWFQFGNLLNQVVFNEDTLMIVSATEHDIGTATFDHAQGGSVVAHDGSVLYTWSNLSGWESYNAGGVVSRAKVHGGVYAWISGTTVTVWNGVLARRVQLGTALTNLGFVTNSTHGFVVVDANQVTIIKINLSTMTVENSKTLQAISGDPLEYNFSDLEIFQDVLFYNVQRAVTVVTLNSHTILPTGTFTSLPYQFDDINLTNSTVTITQNTNPTFPTSSPTITPTPKDLQILPTFLAIEVPIAIKPSIPILQSTVPAFNANLVLLDTDLQLTFDVPVLTKLGGNLEVLDFLTGNVIQTIDVGSVGLVSGNIVDVDFTGSLDYARTYYVTVGDDAIESTANIAYPGIADNTTWQFTTRNPPAVFVGSVPADNSTGVPINTTITLTIDQAINKGTGNIQVYYLANNVLVEDIDVTSNSVVVGGNSAVITLGANLVNFEEYYVNVDDGAFLDADLLTWDGLSGNSAVNFRSVDFDPVVTSSNPADEATGVSTIKPMTLTFNTNVFEGSGNITIRYSSNNAVSQTINIANSIVSTNTVRFTIEHLNFQDQYYIAGEAGAVDNVDGVAWAGITDPTFINFTTETSFVSLSTFAGATGFGKPVSGGPSGLLIPNVNGVFLDADTEVVVANTRDIATFKGSDLLGFANSTVAVFEGSVVRLSDINTVLDTADYDVVISEFDLYSGNLNLIDNGGQLVEVDGLAVGRTRAWSDFSAERVVEDWLIGRSDGQCTVCRLDSSLNVTAAVRLTGLNDTVGAVVIGGDLFVVCNSPNGAVLTKFDVSLNLLESRVIDNLVAKDVTTDGVHVYAVTQFDNLGTQAIGLCKFTNTTLQLVHAKVMTYPQDLINARVTSVGSFLYISALQNATDSLVIKINTDLTEGTLESFPNNVYVFTDMKGVYLRPRPVGLVSVSVTPAADPVVTASTPAASTISTPSAYVETQNDMDTPLFQLTNTVPASGSSNVATNSVISATFDDTVFENVGNVVLYSYPDTVVTEIPIANTIISGNTVTLPAQTLEKNSSYYVTFDSSVLKTVDDLLGVGWESPFVLDWSTEETKYGSQTTGDLFVSVIKRGDVVVFGTGASDMVVSEPTLRNPYKVTWSTIDNLITKFYDYDTDKILAGTRTGGVDALTVFGPSGEFVDRQVTLTGTQLNEVFVIGGDVWVASSGHGIIRLDSDLNVLSQITTNLAGAFTGIYHDGVNALGVGPISTDSLFAVYDGSAVIKQLRFSGNSTTQLKYVRPTSTGFVLIGLSLSTLNSIIVINLDSSYNYESHYYIKASDTIATIDDCITVGTDSYLVGRYQESATNRWYVYDLTNGTGKYLSTSVSALYHEGGVLWLAGENGYRVPLNWGNNALLNDLDFRVSYDIGLTQLDTNEVWVVSSHVVGSGLNNVYGVKSVPSDTKVPVDAETILATSFSPSGNDVLVNSNLTITFDTVPVIGTGNITVYYEGNSQVQQTFSATLGVVVGNDYTVKPPSNLEYHERQYVFVDSGALVGFTGVSSRSLFVFRCEYPDEIRYENGLGVIKRVVEDPVVSDSYLCLSVDNNDTLVSRIDSDYRQVYTRSFNDAINNLQVVGGVVTDGGNVYVSGRIGSDGYLVRLADRLTTVGDSVLVDTTGSVVDVVMSGGEVVALGSASSFPYIAKFDTSLVVQSANRYTRSGTFASAALFMVGGAGTNVYVGGFDDAGGYVMLVDTATYGVTEHRYFGLAGSVCLAAYVDGGITWVVSRLNAETALLMKMDSTTMVSLGQVAMRTTAQEATVGVFGGLVYCSVNNSTTSELFVFDVSTMALTAAKTSPTVQSELLLTVGRKAWVGETWIHLGDLSDGVIPDSVADVFGYNQEWVAPTDVYGPVVFPIGTSAYNIITSYDPIIETKSYDNKTGISVVGVTPVGVVPKSGANLVVQYDNTVSVGSGSVRLYRDGAQETVIPVGNGTVIGVGTEYNVVTPEFGSYGDSYVIGIDRSGLVGADGLGRHVVWVEDSMSTVWEVTGQSVVFGLTDGVCMLSGNTVTEYTAAQVLVRSRVFEGVVFNTGVEFGGSLFLVGSSDLVGQGGTECFVMKYTDGVVDAVKLQGDTGNDSYVDVVVRGGEVQCVAQVAGSVEYHRYDSDLVTLGRVSIGTGTVYSFNNISGNIVDLAVDFSSIVKQDYYSGGLGRDGYVMVGTVLTDGVSAVDLGYVPVDIAVSGSVVVTLSGDRLNVLTTALVPLFSKDYDVSFSRVFVIGDYVWATGASHVLKLNHVQGKEGFYTAITGSGGVLVDHVQYVDPNVSVPAPLQGSFVLTGTAVTESTTSLVEEQGVFQLGDRTQYEKLETFVVSSVPSTYSTDLPRTQTWDVEFSGPVTQSTGNVQIHRVDDNSVYDVTSNLIVLGNVVTITPTIALNYFDRYYLSFESNAFLEYPGSQDPNLINGTVQPTIISMNLFRETASVDTNESNMILFDGTDLIVAGVNGDTGVLFEADSNVDVTSAYRYSGGGVDSYNGFKMDSGNATVVGYSSTSSIGLQDGLVVRYESGAVVNHRLVGVSGGVTSFESVSDNWLVGTLNNDVLLCDYDGSNVVGFNTISGLGVCSVGGSVMDGSNVVVVGGEDATLANRTGWLVKFDGSSLSAQVHLVVGSFTELRGVAVYGSGYVAVGISGVNALVVTLDSSLVVTGSVYMDQVGSTDVFNGVVVDGSEIWAVGYTEIGGARYGYVAQFDSGLNVLRHFVVGGTGEDEFRSVTYDTGYVYACGLQITETFGGSSANTQFVTKMQKTLAPGTYVSTPSSGLSVTTATLTRSVAGLTTSTSTYSLNTSPTVSETSGAGLHGSTTIEKIEYVA